MNDVTEIVLDPAAAGEPFPPIHDGRYEVDPWATKLVAGEVPPGLAEAVKRAGVRLLRVGVGCWLPSQDPDPSTLHEREWFTGSTLDDVADPARFDWTHLDRNLDLCAELGVELLLCFDSMPASLARPGPQVELPDFLKPYAPEGYTFPNGVRNAPPADPEVFAAASVELLRHVEARGVPIRYVELWNEPDLPFFYSGTFDEWWAMYVPFARAVSAAGYRVGGPSWAGALEPELWLEQLLVRSVAEDVPLDFYSFHRYVDRVDEVIDRCREIRSVLDRVGLTATELVLDEWGYDLRQAEVFGTVHNAAFVAACLMQFPGAGVAAQTNILLIDPVAPELGRFHGLTRQNGDPNPVFFTMEAFERFQATPHQMPTALGDRLLAGVNRAKDRLTVILANPDPQPRELSLSLTDGTAAGSLRRLTQESFDDQGGYADEPIVFGSTPTSVVLAPDTLAVIEADLAR